MFSGRWRAGLAALVSIAAAFAARGEVASPFLSPVGGESLAPGSIVEVRWTSACTSVSGARADEAEVVLSLDGGLTFPIRVSNELPPCATRHLWRVPALATGRARLALRTGSEGLLRTERLRAVSGDFRILSDVDGRVQELYRRAAEWWTPPEATALTAEDLFGGAMSSSAGRILVPFVATEIAAAPAPATGRDAGRTAVALAHSAGSVPRARSVLSVRPGAAAPLRL